MVENRCHNFSNFLHTFTVSQKLKIDLNDCLNEYLGKKMILNFRAKTGQKGAQNAFLCMELQ